VTRFTLTACIMLATSANVWADQPSTQQLIEQVRKNGHYSCIECHGAKGTPPITDKYAKQSPILAGQKYQYLVQQLQHFKDGSRYTKEMGKQLIDYSDAEIKRIADYFSNQVIDKKLTDPTIDTLKHTLAQDQQWVIKGNVLFHQGDSERGIVACVSCHIDTPNTGQKLNHAGHDAVKLVPNIAGQHARYVRMTLNAYQKAQRTTDNNQQKAMQHATKALSADDIKNLAAYIQSIQ